MTLDSYLGFDTAHLSYFMAEGTNPPSITYSPNTNRAGQPKDTLRNIQATGEYIVNVVSYDMRERMNLTAAEFPADVSEWDQAGFVPMPAVKVRPARVTESPLAMECRLYQIVSHGNGPTAVNYVIDLTQGRMPHESNCLQESQRKPTP